ncbi:MAG: hypothetical protein ACRD1C_10050 [Terriglobales bacterium]
MANTVERHGVRESQSEVSYRFAQPDEPAPMALPQVHLLAARCKAPEVLVTAGDHIRRPSLGAPPAAEGYSPRDWRHGAVLKGGPQQLSVDEMNDNTCLDLAIQIGKPGTDGGLKTFEIADLRGFAEQLYPMCQSSHLSSARSPAFFTALASLA